jgi:hypothetical protein
MTVMTPRRFDWGLRVHGTDLAAWPAAERAAALSLLRRCAETRQALADALAGEDLPLPDPALLASLQGRLKQRASGWAEPPRPRVLRRGVLGGMLTVCAVAGFYLGSASLDAEQPDLFGAVQAIAIDAAL